MFCTAIKSFVDPKKSNFRIPDAQVWTSLPPRPVETGNNRSMQTSFEMNPEEFLKRSLTESLLNGAIVW